MQWAWMGPEGGKAHPLWAGAHFWTLLTLSPPSRDVHGGAVTLSQPSVILGVTVMATNPTVPSLGDFQGFRGIVLEGTEISGILSGTCRQPWGEGGCAKSPRAQHRINKSSLCPGTALTARALLDHQEFPFAFFPPEASLRSCSSLDLLGLIPWISLDIT